jgi:hypothetical protein
MTPHVLPRCFIVWYVAVRPAQAFRIINSSDLGLGSSDEDMARLVTTVRWGKRHAQSAIIRTGRISLQRGRVYRHRSIMMELSKCTPPRQ